MNIWKNLIILLTSPSYGWNMIAKYNIPKDYLFGKMFGPLLGILSISVFTNFFYTPEITLITLLQNVIAQVGVYYFGYLSSAYILTVLNHGGMENGQMGNRIYIFTMYCYALLMLMRIAENLIPPGLIDIFEILPLYIAFVIWKAKDYINPDYKESRFIFIFGLSVLIPYYFLYFTLNALL